MHPNQVRARLMEQGLSYRQWALARGFDPHAVALVVRRYAGASTLPRGRQSYRILRDLSRTIGQEVTPGILRGDGL